MTGGVPLTEYSSGYYAIDLRITPFESGPIVDSQLFQYIDENVYANTDSPVWMRASFQPSPHFTLGSDGPMPADLIGLPTDFIEDLALDQDKEYHTFFVCKPGHAHYLSQSVLFGDTFEEDDPDA